jgi:hypothetical protein
MVLLGPYDDVEGAVAVGAVDPDPELTVTVKLHQELCPSLDLAFTCTVVVPTGNTLPDAGVPVIVIGATPPEVVAL